MLLVEQIKNVKSSESKETALLQAGSATFAERESMQFYVSLDAQGKTY